MIGTVLLGMAVQNGQAQGVVNLNNYDANSGNGWAISLGNATTPAPMGTYYEVLGGPNATSLQPILNSSGQGPIFTTPDNTGFFDNGYGAVTGVAAQGTATLELLAWTGSATYANATHSAMLQWTQTLGTPGNPLANPPTTPSPTVLAIPGAIVMTSVPEPSTIALVGLGLAGLVSLRRRK